MLECPQCGRLYASDVSECPEDGTVLRADPTVAADIPVDPLVGRTFDDKYRLDARLGEGGMGTVYRATHLLIERPVAVKVLNPRMVTDEAARERFRREARASGRIQHSNAVAVTDFGETRDGLVYIVMELLEGRPLRELLARESPLDPARAVSLMLQAAAAVAAAHEAGVIHRDLKPGNIFVVQRPHVPHIVKVLDFGIAKLGADPTDGGEGNPINTLTGTGVMIGTPRYMSPEQCDGAPLTPASDVYSLGVILYEMLTGQTPFTGATPLALALKHSSEPPRSLREIVPTVPPPLEEVVLRALAKSPQERPQDAGEFRRELYYVAERLGLEHSAGFSAPTIESLRDAGTETPSGRLVIDIERLRSNRATAQTSEAVIETAEGDVFQTGGRPAVQTPSSSSSSSASDASPAASSSTPSPSAVPSSTSQTSRARRAPDGGGWKAWLTQPPVLVVLICVALLVLAGVFTLLRSSNRSGAIGPGAALGDEAEDAIGRDPSASEQAPRGRSFAQPRNAAEFYQNGAYYISVHSYDAAVRDLRRAVELQPQFPEAHNRLGRALLRKGQYGDAAESFRTAVRQRGGKYPTAQYNLGFALQSQGKTDDAVEAYNQAIETSGGKYPDAHYQVGSILLGIPGRAGEAVAPLRKAIEQNGGRDPEAHFKLGAALAQQKDYANAEAALRTAIDQRGGDFAYAHYNLALLYEETGRTTDAIREFETFLQQAPRDENRRRVENSLRDLRRRAGREASRQPPQVNRQEGNQNQ
ncbi:MAG TPA: serine/threonine-protein kinase [Pyrinomonadaceae bacterium]|nr:serine/threonine-protein kinase [Pyrinomonadaceae bacterium]